jgi:hypothetical protein
MVTKQKAVRWIKDNPKKFKLYISLLIGIMFVFIFIVAAVKIYFKKNVNYVLMVDGQAVYTSEFDYYCSSLAEISDEYSNDRQFKLRCAVMISEMMAIKNEADFDEKVKFDHLNKIVEKYSEQRLSDIYLEARFINLEKQEAKQQILDDIKKYGMELTLDEYIKKDAENQNIHKSLAFKWDVDFFKLRMVSDFYLGYKINQELGKLIDIESVKEKYQEIIGQFKEEAEYIYDCLEIPYKYVANDLISHLKARNYNNIKDIIVPFKKYNVTYTEDLRNRESEFSSAVVKEIKKLHFNEKKDFNNFHKEENITPLIETDSGYRIYFIKGMVPERTLLLKDVKDKVISRIYSENFNLLKRKIKEKITEKHNIFINQKVLRKL